MESELDGLLQSASWQAKALDQQSKPYIYKEDFSDADSESSDSDPDIPLNEVLRREQERQAEAAKAKAKANANAKAKPIKASEVYQRLASSSLRPGHRTWQFTR